MNNVKLDKVILEHCKKGEFHTALELVHQNFENDIGIKLLVNCCHGCLDSSKNICMDSLYELLKYIVPTIRKPNELELLTYIQSVYHILNSFIKKDLLDIIIDMENILLPPFLPSELSEKQKNTFNSIALILYNVVAKRAGENDTSKNGFMLEICLLVSKISSNILEPLDALDRSYKCFVNLVCLKLPVDKEIQYYKEVLILWCSNTHNDHQREEFFKVILNFSSMILNNILKSFDFQKAFDYFQTISDVVGSKAVLNEFICCHQVLKSCLIISPIKLGNESEELIKCAESLDKLDEMISETDVQEKLREKLFILFKNVTYYYQTVQGNEWAAFPESLQLEIMYFIASLSKKHHNQIFSSLQMILHLIELQIKQKPNSSINYHEKTLEILNMFSNQMISLKEQNIDAWKKLWNTMGIKAYNIGICSWRTNNCKVSALLYLNFLLKMYLTLENRNSPIILEKPTLSSCIRVICEMYSKSPKTYLMHTALAIYLCPSNRESFMGDWVKLKHSEREQKGVGFHEIQQVTLVSALRLLQESTPIFKYSLKDSDKLQLLEFELKQYKKRWRSKIPIMSVLKELHKLPDIEKKAEIIVDIFGDCEMPLHDDCLVILMDILNQYKTRVEPIDVKSKLYLGILYYLTYKYCIANIISKNAEDMAKLSMVTPVIELSNGTNCKDSKEKCDVVSAYESSALEEYLNILNNLDESLAIFSSVVPELNETCEMGCVSTSQLYNHLLRISYEYRLFGHRLRCLQASELALKYAQIQNNIVGIVQMTGFIIEFSNLQSKYLQDLVKTADTLLKLVDGSNVENLKIIMIYHICKSKALFNHDLKESYKVFELCMDLMESRKADEEGFVIVKSQLHLLKFKFTTLPCELGIGNHEENSLLDGHTAASTILKEYGKEHVGNSYAISILLDANEELIKLYHLMRCPRDVYAYGREILLLAQKLVSPLRCATFLMYLAHADLRNNSLSDCQVKLDGMAYILSANTRLEPSSTTSTESNLDLPNEQKHFRELSPSSPGVEIETFRFPLVSRHGVDCDCFYCVCFEYQVLVLEKTRLSALLNVKQNNDSIAHAYFEGTLNLYKHYNDSTISNPEKFSKIIHCDIVPDFRKEFTSPYGFILLNFSNHLHRNNKKAEAFDMNEKLIDILVEKKSDFVYLYNEAIVQKCVYLTESLYREPLEEIENDMECLTINHVPDIPRTPESKTTKISFPVECKTPDISPTIPSIKKRLVFTLSPGEDTIGNNETTLKNRLQKSNIRTPAPKIQIYTEETSEKKSVRKKSQYQNLNVPSTSKKVPSETNSISSDMESGLKTRTRLLTEKLKQTSKNNDAGCAVDTFPKNVKSSNKCPVKKNLLPELVNSGSEQSTSKTGAVRKSTRNKK